MWNKKLLILLAILIIPLVFADKGIIETYTPGQLVDLSIHLSNDTGDVIGANCSAQIRNLSQSILSDISLAEIGQGWYNATYNTTTIGKYYCRQNCTQGSLYVATTCDFIIGVEDNMVFGIIIFIPMFIAIFLLIISWILPGEKYPALKIGLILVGFVFIFQAYQYATITVGALFNIPSLIDAIGENTFIYTMVFWMVLSIFLITFIYDIFMIFKNKRKTGDYSEDGDE